MKYSFTELKNTNEEDFRSYGMLVVFDRVLMQRRRFLWKVHI